MFCRLPAPSRVPMLAVLVGLWVMGATQAGSGGTTICAGPWVQAEGYDWCRAGRPAVDPETGEEGIAEIADAFLVYCRRGWLRDKMLRVEGGWMHRANRTRNMVCESRRKVRGVEYPPEVANALTR